jgi:exosortase A
MPASVTSPAQGAIRLRVGLARWLPSLVALSAGVSGFAVMFSPEICAAFQVWLDSTAYTHCFLVLPITGYLLWDRRLIIRTVVPEPRLRTALFALPLGLLWLIAWRIGVMEGRQLVALSMLQVLVLSIMGWGFWRRMSGPLLFLYFLVPFGAFLVPVLQSATTGIIAIGLSLASIPAYVDGNVIEIPEGSFLVAEACAGLRFLIASVAFGCLYALLMYRSPYRRLVFLVVTLIVPVVANGFRAFLVIWLGHYLGSPEAASADHILYGWSFFSVILLGLTIGGAPFRQDRKPIDRIPGAPGTSSVAAWPRSIAAMVIVLVCSAIWPAGAAIIDRVHLVIQTSFGQRLSHHTGDETNMFADRKR